MDARLALSRVRTMAEIRRKRSLSGTTEPAWVIGALAAIAALLAGLGLYGVLAHTVLQQRQERQRLLTPASPTRNKEAEVIECA